MNRQRNLSPTLRSIAPIFAILLAFALAACSPGDTDQTAADQSVDKAAETTEITLYSGQHESLAKALAGGFERDTGIQVRLRAGKDGALANQIIEEGDRKSTRLNSSHVASSYAVFCLKKKQARGKERTKMKV